MYNFLQSKRVLYVEDEVDVLVNISTLLSNFFHTFYTASDGLSAYKIFQQNEIDLLLVDIELPKMNGIELIKKIRDTDTNVPIVIISAYTKTDYLLESVELGLDKYIVKPLTSKKIHDLLIKLNKHFSQDNIICLGSDIYLDKESYTISHNGNKYTLSQRELDFLTTIAYKRMIGYDEISSLWEDSFPTENAIRSYIKHLRKKLPNGLLKNRNGVGYYLENYE